MQYLTKIDKSFDSIEFARQVMEDVFSNLTKTGVLVESIVNQCLGLPTNFLKEFNHDRSSDVMIALRYFPATDT